MAGVGAVGRNWIAGPSLDRAGAGVEGIAFERRHLERRIHARVLLVDVK
jgi:hypothetical protein